jgi:DNA-binding MarR family transcriptional regulator
VRDDEVRELRSAITVLARRMRRDVLSAHGLSRPAVSVLAALARQGETTPGDLAVELQMTSSNVAAALREVDTAGLVRRLRDPHDGRRSRVSLRPSGERVVREIRAERDTWLGRAIEAELDDREQELLRAAADLLGRVARRAEGSGA